MLSSITCIKVLGNPNSPKALASMVKLAIPGELQPDCLPDHVYCNKYFADKFLTALENLKEENILSEFKEFGGIFSVRPVRGGSTPSLHSWGLAIDINPSTNPLQKTSKKRTLSDKFIKCFKDAGFDWGGDFKSRFDPMHFQVRELS